MVRVIVYGGKIRVKDHQVQKSDYKPYNDYDKHMKIYRCEQKDKSKSTMHRQQVQDD